MMLYITWRACDSVSALSGVKASSSQSADVVLLVIAAGGVLHDDGIARAEVVEEPLCVPGWADVDVAVAESRLPWSSPTDHAVHEVADIVDRTPRSTVTL